MRRRRGSLHCQLLWPFFSEEGLSSSFSSDTNSALPPNGQSPLLSFPPPPFSAVFSDQGFREFRSSKRRREGEDAKMEAVLFLFQFLGAVFWIKTLSSFPVRQGCTWWPSKFRRPRPGPKYIFPSVLGTFSEKWKIPFPILFCRRSCG